MNKESFVGGALLFAVAILAAAYQSHGLEGGEKAIRLWGTANLWHALNAIGVMVVSVAFDKLLPQLRWTALGTVVAGTFIFSGSIYAQSMTGAPLVGGSAPLGGSLMIIGWVLIAVAAVAQKRESD